MKGAGAARRVPQGFRDLQLRREVRRDTSVYNGIFNLLVLRGARDWMTGNVPQYGDLDDHHIVPKDWRKNHPLGNLIDTILNRTPLTADTNRKVIRNRLPNAYLPELIAENGESTVRATLETHLISPTAFDILLRDPFTPDDFEAFLAERQRTIQAAIEDLLVKERLDLPPQLRELDAQMEEVELASAASSPTLSTATRPACHPTSRRGSRNGSRPQPGRIPPRLGPLRVPGRTARVFRSPRIAGHDRQQTALACVPKPLWDAGGSCRTIRSARWAAQRIRHSRTVDEVTRKLARQRSSGSAKSSRTEPDAAERECVSRSTIYKHLPELADGRNPAARQIPPSRPGLPARLAITATQAARSEAGSGDNATSGSDSV